MTNTKETKVSFTEYPLLTCFNHVCTTTTVHMRYHYPLSYKLKPQVKCKYGSRTRKPNALLKRCFCAHFFPSQIAPEFGFLVMKHKKRRMLGCMTFPPCLCFLPFLCFMTRNPNFGAIWLGKKGGKEASFNKAFGFLVRLR